MDNYYYLLRIFDVAEEIKLDRVEKVLSQIKPTSRMKLSRIRPKSIHIANPPVTMELGEDTYDFPGLRCKVFYYARIYDLGVISVTMRISIPSGLDYQSLHSLAVYLYNNQDLEAAFSQKLTEVSNTLLDAMIKPENTGFVEDYIIYYFHNWNLDWDPAPLLLAETEPLSDQIRREINCNSFSYGKDDLAVITWDSALVYDPTGSADIPDLLEFANSQLLELRYYDNLLSEEMIKMYDSLEEAGTIGRYRRGGHYRRIMNSLMELVIDISEITERIHNSLKLTEDVFYARVYGTALKILRTHAWEESIERKINTIQNNYTLLSNEVATQQSNILEVTIVLLILLEVLLALGGVIG
ncbi:MAG: hypothetical protein JL50_18505 [Peptococcaceae bacterium BICA1-7]|nr:MAG: hypothetical protein JL50_18505 [Peptococcaceae bacterium BICA1-7]HBV99074.1 hypothetical protein [Desulfotomaculum sp.]